MPAVGDGHRHAQPATFGQRGGEVFVPTAEPGVDRRGEPACFKLLGEELSYLGSQPSSAGRVDGRARHQAGKGHQSAAGSSTVGSGTEGSGSARAIPTARKNAAVSVPP